MKVSELSGALLDYWVAKCEGRASRIAEYTDGNRYCVVPAGVCGDRGWTSPSIYSPSTAWSVAGQIIDREHLSIEYLGSSAWRAGVTREDGLDIQEPGLPWPLVRHGETALTAAMRAYIASKMGEDVPDEVLA